MEGKVWGQVREGGEIYTLNLEWLPVSQSDIPGTYQVVL